MRPALLSVVAAVLLVALSADAGAADKKFEKKFSVSGGGTLTISTDVGAVRINGSSGNEVSITAQIRGRERDVENFEITADQSGNNVSVKGRTHKGGGWFWNSTDLDVEFVISVPREYSLQMNTSGGDIAVTELKGVVKGKTSGGDIGVGGVEGDVDLETSGGDVQAEKCKGKIHMETSGGDIRIMTISGDVEVNTSGGNVRINDVEGKVHAETSGGNIVVKVLGTNKGVHAETSGGNIDIVMPKSIAANIDAATSGGEVMCDMPVTISGKIDESRVRGTVNGGGNVIFAHTSGGNVHIRAVE